MPEKILIIEDESSLRETLAYRFQQEGYEVKTSANGGSGLDLARTWQPDLLLLDVMLPGLDGFEICRRLKAESNLPILLVTARGDEIDRVVGLEIGADDYITKPFSLRELIARVKTRLRIYHQLQAVKAVPPGTDPKPGDELIFGNLVQDRKRHEFRLDGIPLGLKPREYDLLTYLVENHGRAVSRENILTQVWGWDYIGESRTVDVHIRWLRNKIELDPSKPQRIVTIPGIGYRFED